MSPQAKQTPHKIPTIDFRGLHPSKPYGELWSSVRDEVLPALQNYGCLEAIYDGVSPAVKEALFTKAAPELLAVPLEKKLKTKGNLLSNGYIGQLPGLDYESLNINGAQKLDSIEDFSRLMWPIDGNPSFCKIVWAYEKGVRELDQMIQRMVMQSLGVEKYYESLVESEDCGFRIAQYGSLAEPESNLVFPAHCDAVIIAIVGQYNVHGLEVQTKDGEWMQTQPHFNSFTVIVGDLFQVWSNGRLEAGYHRVTVAPNSERRYSAVHTSIPGTPLLEVAQELVDDAHPLQYNSCFYPDWIKFRYLDEGQEKDALKEFCGVKAKVE